jgi:repressor LexA
MLSYIKSYITEHGYPPSVADIGRGCAIPSTSSVAYHLDLLERYGYIERTREIARGIRVVS